MGLAPPTGAPPAAVLTEERDARRVLRREVRRRRLLESALRLFSELGYHETAVDDIVADARTSKSAFYEFFDSKQDCFRELLADRGGELIHTVVSAAERGADHRDRMRRGITALVAACAAERPLARLMLTESVGLSPGVEDVRRQLHGRFAAMVEAEARAAAASDAFYAAQDAAVLGRAVVGAVNEAVGHFLEHEDADPQALAASLGRIFAP
jgi:AcrR family transcriptional regulator